MNDIGFDQAERIILTMLGVFLSIVAFSLATAVFGPSALLIAPVYVWGLIFVRWLW